MISSPVCNIELWCCFHFDSIFSLQEWRLSHSCAVLPMPTRRCAGDVVQGKTIARQLCAIPVSVCKSFQGALVLCLVEDIFPEMQQTLPLLRGETDVGIYISASSSSPELPPQQRKCLIETGIKAISCIWHQPSAHTRAKHRKREEKTMRQNRKHFLIHSLAGMHDSECVIGRTIKLKYGPAKQSCSSE